MWKAFTRRRHKAVQVEVPAPAAAAEKTKAQRNREFFEDLWRQGDYWNLETDPFEQGKYQRQIELIGDRRYRKILEIGCGAGAFTRMLAPLAERVVALDVSPQAIERAKARVVEKKGDIHPLSKSNGGLEIIRGGVGERRDGVIDFRVANILEYKPQDDGPFDLIVLGETIYYLGWLYTFFEIGWLAATLFDATADDGRLIMTNTAGAATSYLHRPWLLASYADLLRNVGYRLDVEETFTGEKSATRLEASICLFSKPKGSGAVAV